jgi:hypothetical protein
MPPDADIADPRMRMRCGLAGVLTGYGQGVSEPSVPWPCQVLFSDQSDTVVVLALIAMAPCALDDAEMASGTPFTIRLRCDECDTFDLIDDWVRDGRVITLREVHVSDQRWLYLSGQGRYLVMQLSSSPRR